MPERAAAEIGAGRRKDRRVGIVLLHGVLQPKQVVPCRGKRDDAIGKRDALVQRAAAGARCSRGSSFHAQSHVVSSSTSVQRAGGGLEAASSAARFTERVAFSFARSAGQSRQKSGLMQGLCEMRMLLSSRNRLIGAHQRAMA